MDTAGPPPASALSTARVGPPPGPRLHGPAPPRLWPRSAAIGTGLGRRHCPGTGTATETGTGTGTASDSGIGTGPGSGTGYGIGTGMEAGISTTTGMGTGIGIGTGTDSGTGTDTRAGTGSGTGNGIGTETGSETETGRGTRTRTWTGTGTNTGTEIGTGTGTAIGTGTATKTGHDEYRVGDRNRDWQGQEASTGTGATLPSAPQFRSYLPGAFLIPIPLKQPVPGAPPSRKPQEGPGGAGAARGEPWIGSEGSSLWSSAGSEAKKTSCLWRSPWRNDEDPKGALKWSLKGTCGDHWGQPCRAKRLLTAQGSPREGQRMSQRMLVSLIAMPGAGCGMSRLWSKKHSEKELRPAGPVMGEMFQALVLAPPDVCVNTEFSLGVSAEFLFGRGSWVLGFLEAVDLCPSSWAGAVGLCLFHGAPEGAGRTSGSSQARRVPVLLLAGVCLSCSSPAHPVLSSGDY
ncbi:protein SPT2 homolog [Cinclus cinclus]|uniref:protein SPT2 homolog n=1 Tax=Cinclus cinclus TaxID=127875 RepID=UPI002E0D36C7